MTDAGTVDIINRTLDTVKYERGLNETELADFLTVNVTTVWRWRQGRNLCPAARVLLPLVFAFAQRVATTPMFPPPDTTK